MSALHKLRLRLYHARRTMKQRLTESPDKPLSAGQRKLLVGRAAATSPVDMSREELLVELCGRELVEHGDVIAFVGTDDTAHLLEGMTNIRLHPGTCLTVAMARQPTVILVDERAFQTGNWYGTLSTAGESLFTDIRQLLRWATDAGALVVGIRDHAPTQTHTAVLRAHYRETLPLDPHLVRPHDIPADSLILTLQERLESEVTR